MSAHPLLMIPGPTELPLEVTQAMGQPAVIQYDAHFELNVLEKTTLALRRVFQTERCEVLLMPGSGRTGIEACAVSLIEPGDKVLVVNSGQFGVLMRDIMGRAGAAVTDFAVEWGRPLDLEALAREVERVRPKALTLVHNETSTGAVYPAAEVGRIAKRSGALFLLDTASSLAGMDVQTDGWGVDLHMSATQKCLAAPLGLALASVSPEAFEAMERRRTPSTSWAYDLLRWKENWIPASRGGRVAEGGFRKQPVSIPSHLTQALSAATTLVLQEGLAARIRRHASAARAMRAAVEAMGLRMFPDASLYSDTVSCFYAPEGMRPDAVVAHLREHHGIVIGTGLERIRATTLRVAHMGLTASPRYLLPTLSALELTLAALGHTIEPGAGLAAAQRVFAEASRA